MISDSPKRGIIDLMPENAAMPPYYCDPDYAAFINGLDKVHAVHYSGISNKIEMAMKSDLMKLVTVIEPPIVDLGCGTGSGFPKFGDPATIIGVDRELKLLSRAMETYPQAKFYRSTIHDLPLADKSIMTSFAIAVLEHVFHLERSLENVARFLHPQGKFYVLVPTEGGLAVEAARRITSRRNAAMLGMTPAQARRAQRKDHCNTVFAIESALKKYFRIEATSYWPFGIFGSLANLSKSFRLSPL